MKGQLSYLGRLSLNRNIPPPPSHVLKRIILYMGMTDSCVNLCFCWGKSNIII